MGAKNKIIVDAIPAAAKIMGQERVRQAMREALAQGCITAEEAAVIAEEVTPW